MQSIARDSEDSTDDEFFDAHGKPHPTPPPPTVLSLLYTHKLFPPTEDFSDNEEIFVKDITKWSSNDLMDKIETIEVDEAQGRLPPPLPQYSCTDFMNERAASFCSQQKHCTRRRGSSTPR